MLDDRHLEELLCAAHQVDLMEQESAQSTARHTWKIERTVAWVAGGLAAAAAVALVANLSWPVGGAAVPDGSGPVAVRPVPEVIAKPAEARESVLMAIAEDDAGGLRCVKWSPGVWGQRPLSDVASEELRSIGLSLGCETAVRRLLVVGMEGPTALLPHSDAHASEVAQCILRQPPCAADGFDRGACSAAGGGCVGSDVSVRVELIAGR